MKNKKNDRLILLLTQARHRLMTNLDKSLMETVGITGAQTATLFYLMENNGCLLSQLSKGLMLDNSAITGMVDRLEKKKFVKRRNSTSDRRAINIYLTDAGQEAAVKGQKIVNKYNQTIKKGFSSEEVNAFKRILNAVIERF